MYTGDDICHTSTIEIDTDPHLAFAYLSDGIKQGDWTLGSMQRELIDDNLYKGISLFNGATLYIKIDADIDRLTIFYHVGPAPEELQPRNMIRVVPGPVVGKPENQCLVTLLSWRSALADDTQWQLTCVSHETEMHIIKNRIENIKT